MLGLGLRWPAALAYGALNASQSTKRLPLVEEFTPEESEHRLYNLVSDYLQRDNLQALPASQRSLMTLVLRKLLASSTFAIAFTKARELGAAEKLEAWADDLKLGLEREIKEIDRQIKDVRRAAATALTLEEKLAGQKEINALESQRNEQRRSLFEARDNVDYQREELIANIEGKLTQRSELQTDLRPPLVFELTTNSFTLSPHVGDEFQRQE